MGIPERTVEPLNYADDVYQSIDTEAIKRGMCDMDVWCAWRLGLAAYDQLRNLGGVLPHDQTPNG